VSAPDATLSHGEFVPPSGQLVHRLRALEVKPKTPVGLCLERAAGSVGVLGILKDGGAFLAEYDCVGQTASTPGSLSRQLVAGRTPMAARLLEIRDEPRLRERLA
jgi:non-ribosomal peptide synthetase component F